MPGSPAVACIPALLVGSTAGCASPAGSSFVEVEADPGFPGEPDDPARHERLFRFQARPACEPAGRLELGLQAELRIFRGPGVSMETVRSMLGGLQRYYAWYGVDFFTRHEVIDVPATHLITFDPDAIRQFVIEETGLDPSRGIAEEDAPRVEASIARATIHNLVELLRVYGVPSLPVVNVMVLPEIVDAGDEEVFGGTVVGLGISPALLGNEQFAAFATLFEDAGIPGDFTAFAAVGARPTTRLVDLPDAVIAHEVGHAFGLPHGGGFDNLLGPGTPECSVGLDRDQLERVRESLLGASAVRAPLVSLTGRLGEVPAIALGRLRAGSGGTP